MSHHVNVNLSRVAWQVHPSFLFEPGFLVPESALAELSEQKIVACSIALTILKGVKIGHK
jgi:hypothetical protein